MNNYVKTIDKNMGLEILKCEPTWQCFSFEAATIQLSLV